MISNALFLLIALLLLSSAMLHAQQPGVDCAPIQGQGWQGCAPLNNGTQQPARQQPALPPPLWMTRWGAIATDGHGHLGAVTGLSSKSNAQRAAIADCQAKGGSQCSVDVAYDNECAAMVAGHPGYNVNADATLNKAIQAAMQSCSNAGNTNCHVYYSACSLPVRIQ